MKKFYMEMYPTDEWGADISETATFEGMLDADDIYEYIGVGCSVIRERLMAELARRSSTPYKLIYDIIFKCDGADFHRIFAEGKLNKYTDIEYSDDLLQLLGDVDNYKLYTVMQQVSTACFDISLNRDIVFRTWEDFEEFVGNKIGDLSIVKNRVSKATLDRHIDFITDMIIAGLCDEHSHLYKQRGYNDMINKSILMMLKEQKND